MTTYVRMLAGIGCGLLLTVPLARSAAAICPGDQDCDGIPDVLDKCVLDSRNAVYTCDSDQDGYGNPCDADFDQNFVVNTNDYTMYFAPGFSPLNADPQHRGFDMNCNGVLEGAVTGPNSVDYLEFFLPMLQSATPVPGPSGLACAGTPGCN
jgi:hypothetical protein